MISKISLSTQVHLVWMERKFLIQLRRHQIQICFNYAFSACVKVILDLNHVYLQCVQ